MLAAHIVTPLHEQRRRLNVAGALTYVLFGVHREVRG